MNGWLTKYINHQEAPALYIRFPRLLFLYYAVNRLTAGRTWYMRSAIRGVLRRRPSPRTILDAGCGMGDFVFSIPELRGDSVCGIDRSPSNIALCRAVQRSVKADQFSFVCGDLEEYPIPDGVDLIFSVAVLMYLRDDAAFLKKCRAALRDGGKLLLYVPVNNKRWTPLEKLIPRKEGIDYNLVHRVHHRYTTEEIRKKLQDAGFDIESVRHSYGAVGSISYEILSAVERLFKSSHPALQVPLVLVYLAFVPINLLAIWFDLWTKRDTGNGVMIIAGKSHPARGVDSVHG